METARGAGLAISTTNLASKTGLSAPAYPESFTM
jgi:hypothetical protein